MRSANLAGKGQPTAEISVTEIIAKSPVTGAHMARQCENLIRWCIMALVIIKAQND